MTNGIFIYDLETDDLINGDKYPSVLQVCFINYDTNEVMYNNLVFSEIPIAPFITKINNINNEMIKNAPTLDQTRNNLFDIFKKMNKIAVVAHNGTHFDHKIMKYYNLFPPHLDVEYLDSKVIISKLLPNLESYRLQHVYKSIFKTDMINMHSAEGDTRALVQILKKLSW